MPLAHAVVTAPSSNPTRSMLYLHGILGSGANWRTFAKQICQARPDWGAVLVDLRLHGESQPGEGVNISPPHTIAHAANDVADLVAGLSTPARGLLAHSFGGKVALELVRQMPGAFEQVFVIDASPSARPDARGSESTRHIVELLEGLPPEFPDRNAFTRWIEERGVSRPVAMWLAMNVRPIPNTDRFVFRIDVASVREMLDDYFRIDLWDVLEHPRGATQTHFVVGGKSTVLDAADVERARRCPQTTVDVIPEAGHWVHVDAPDALREIVLRYLA
ncbi:MAG: alpha/beta hydrolase [Labilithrix sp.]|nr:alpha/beta hydrolase [Labilithrix sp.]